MSSFHRVDKATTPAGACEGSSQQKECTRDDIFRRGKIQAGREAIHARGRTVATSERGRRGSGHSRGHIAGRTWARAPCGTRDVSHVAGRLKR